MDEPMTSGKTNNPEKIISTHVFDGVTMRFTVRVIEKDGALWLCERSGTEGDMQSLADPIKQAEQMQRRRWQWSVGSMWAHEANMRGIPCYMMSQGKPLLRVHVNDAGGVEVEEVEIQIEDDKDDAIPE